MTWWKDIQTAIEQRDATVLRKMAEEAQKETRMFLNLLAGIIDPTAEEEHTVEEDCLAGGQQG